MQKSISDFSHSEKNEEHKEQKSKYKCYTCGIAIKFVKGQYKKRFNLDGTIHICKSEDKQNYQQTDDFNDRYNAYAKDKADRRRRWWFGYGQYRYKYGYKESYRNYNRKEYEDRYNENRQKREQYKQQYQNTSLDISTALEILGIERVQFDKLEKMEKFRSVKLAYRVVALKFHPDRHPTATEAEKQDFCAKFRKVTEAFEFLESKII